MAKRNQSLVSLSQDHHHGLALALRLMQGDKALLNDGWTHNRRAQSARVGAFYEEELRHHFHAEEQALFPAMERFMPQASVLITQLIREHETMKQLIAKIQSVPEGELEALLVEFGNTLEHHIRSEERELFVMYQNSVTKEQDGYIGNRITASLADSKLGRSGH